MAGAAAGRARRSERRRVYPAAGGRAQRILCGMEPVQLPASETIRSRIAACRAELKELFKLLRLVEAKERADQARQRREAAAAEVQRAS
jgi:hypothetical protein